MVINLAVLQELIAGAIPDREAFIWRDRVFTYAQFNARCRQFAHALRQMGFGCHTERAALQPWESGQDHIAILLYNCNEYLEAMYGAYKARATSVNVNYRYVAEELLYVLNNSRARAIVYHASLAPAVAAIREQAPALERFVQVADESGNPLLDGAVDYDELLASQPAGPLDLPYSGDDLYVLYTGGTTGMPKGVLWRHEDVFYAGLGGHLPGFERLEAEAQIVKHINLGLGGRFIILPPFMHGAAQWTAFNTFHRGGTAVLPDQARRFDAHDVWRTVERLRVDQTTVVGDAFARPLLAALEEGKYDASSFRVVTSTGAVLSPSVKQRLLELLPAEMMFLESFGGSEMGLQAMRYGTEAGEEKGVTSYDLRPSTVILKEDRSAVLDPATARPGPDSEIGWVASSGDIPLGYLDDAEKTRLTFPVIGGVRYSVGGDRAYYGENGRAVILGREALCINTGGEKVYVEEVERVVKSHPAINDALVVGLPSERWGQQITAVVSLCPGHRAPSVAELKALCAHHLADYKIPKVMAVAPEIARSPSGKPDYAWAKDYAAVHVDS